MALARLTKQCRTVVTYSYLRETVSRVVDGKVVTMYKDELEKILYKDLYSHLGLQFGG